MIHRLIRYNARLSRQWPDIRVWPNPAVELSISVYQVEKVAHCHQRQQTTQSNGLGFSPRPSQRQTGVSTKRVWKEGVRQEAYDRSGGQTQRGSGLTFRHKLNKKSVGECLIARLGKSSCPNVRPDPGYMTPATRAALRSRNRCTSYLQSGLDRLQFPSGQHRLVDRQHFIDGYA